MATTSILSIDTTTASSAEITLVAGTIATFSLRDAAGPDLAHDCLVKVKMKASNAELFTFAQMTAANPVINLNMNGVVRFERIAGGSCGVDQS